MSPIEVAAGVMVGVLVAAAVSWKRGAREGAAPFVSWSCHFCGHVRPDARISVATRRREIRPELVLTEHRRYCNDSAGCIEEAFVWVGELEPVELEQ